MLDHWGLLVLELVKNCGDEVAGKGAEPLAQHSRQVLDRLEGCCVQRHLRVIEEVAEEFGQIGIILRPKAVGRLQRLQEILRGLVAVLPLGASVEGGAEKFLVHSQRSVGGIEEHLAVGRRVGEDVAPAAARLAGARASPAPAAVCVVSAIVAARATATPSARRRRGLRRFEQLLQLRLLHISELANKRVDAGPNVAINLHSKVERFFSHSGVLVGEER